MEHTAAAIRERMARDACNVRAYIDYDQNVCNTHWGITPSEEPPSLCMRT
jgi:hypothetical protein